MQKIDRLDWAGGMTFVSHGLRFGIRVNKPEVLEQMLNCLPPGWRLARSPVVRFLYSLIAGGTPTRPHVRLFNILYMASTRLARSLDLGEVLRIFESDLALTVAEMARGKIFLHAGVVGWRGQAIVIPGRSFSGKTTLVRELIGAGATYYSDEFAVLDARGRVFPYARPLSIRETTDEGGLRTTKRSVDTLGGVPGVRPLPVGLVVATRYKPGAGCRLRRVSAGEGAMALLANAVGARQRPKATMAALGHLVAQAPVLKGVRGEARASADWILARFDGLAKNVQPAPER
jgi:hypothetical protein